MKKAILPIFWILAMIGIFELADAFNRKSEHFFGIADNREQNISFQYPVEIIQTLALEGEDVSQGMSILEVKRHDLVSNQNTLDEQIKKLKLEKNEAQQTITSQIESLVANKQSTLADIDQKIHEVEARLQLIQHNKMLAESISGTRIAQETIASETLEIADLHKKSHYAAEAIQAEINNLTRQLNATRRPVDAQIAELQGNKTELQRQNKSLTVNAQFNGRIGSIHFKPGDLVAAFQPIMTVNSATPTNVKGFIQENILNEVRIGQTVWVKSITLNHDEPPLEGVVESLGNRIVEYPERIKKDPLINAWGREVVIRLTTKSSLLFGEKVDIFLNQKEAPFQWLALIGKVHAGAPDARKATPLNVLTTANPTINMKNIEASALLWNPKESHYLLLSDEQDGDKPGIFILDKNAAVTDKLVMQDDISIDDLESISTDGEYIYVSSSLSYNKNDELKSKRKKLLRFKYQHNQVSTQQEIDLFDVLTAIKDQQPESKVATFLTQAMSDHSIDIESHFVKDNALYLGFKAPFMDGSSAVILKLNNVEAIFAGKDTAAEVWQTIALKDPNTGEPTQLSDMVLVDDKLFLLSVARTSAKNSYLWRVMLKDNSLKNLTHFPDVNAEGITYRPDTTSLVVVFDEGKNNISKYQKLTLDGVAQ
ncbi:HlyD family secretion protein [Crenothrix sp.]|uniref:HlyD family secretion protein n=1 Tax=Crenothrix sp. TaxID=3100433 RepID=UPI00374CC474